MECLMPRTSRFSFVQTWTLLFAMMLIVLGVGHLARAVNVPVPAQSLVLLADAVLPLDGVDAGLASTDSVDAGLLPLEGSAPAELAVGLPPLPKEIPTNIDSLDAWGQLALLIYRAVQSKDWQFLVGLILILVMLALRKLAVYVEKHKAGWQGSLAAFFASSFGGTFLLFTTASLGALGSAQLAHMPLTWVLVLDVAKMSLLAAGGWHALVKPLVEFVKTRWAATDKAPTAPAEPPKP